MIATPEKKQSINQGEHRETNYRVAIALVAGVAIGGAAIGGLHAQAKPPVYTVNEIDVTNEAAFVKEYLPLVRASIVRSGGKAIVGTYKVIALEGTAPKRVAIQMWDSMEQAQAWHNQPTTKRLEQSATSMGHHSTATPSRA